MTVDWKKVITSLVAAIAVILASFNIVFPEAIQEIVIIIGTAIMMLLPSILPKKKE